MGLSVEKHFWYFMDYIPVCGAKVGARLGKNIESNVTSSIFGILLLGISTLSMVMSRKSEVRCDGGS